MDERLRFVARRLEGGKVAPLCAEFGISRKTGYKIFERYNNLALESRIDLRRCRRSGCLGFVCEKCVTPRANSKYRSRVMPEVRSRFLMMNTGTGR